MQILLRPPLMVVLNIFPFRTFLKGKCFSRFVLLLFSFCENRDVLGPSAISARRLHDAKHEAANDECSADESSYACFSTAASVFCAYHSYSWCDDGAASSNSTATSASVQKIIILKICGYNFGRFY